VFLCYSSEKGAAFIDRALYLPQEEEEEWAEDSARREEAPEFPRRCGSPL
jgi:hypothetical protein